MGQRWVRGTFAVVVAMGGSGLTTGCGGGAGAMHGGPTACDTDADCAAGEICSHPETGTCTSDSTMTCTTNLDCLVGDDCEVTPDTTVPGQCVPPPPAVACTGDADCADDELCINDDCTPACPDGTSDHCPSGDECLDFYCDPRTATSIDSTGEVSDDDTPGTPGFSTASALFQQTDQYRCSNHAITPRCSFQVCEGNLAATPTNRDAGVITITGGTSPVMLTPDGTSTYSQFFMTQSIWTAGQPVTFAAAGTATIPTFSSTVTQPAPLTLQSPLLPMDGSAMITRASGITFTWTGTSTGTLVVSLTGPQSATKTQSLTYTFPASAGTGTIPAHLLSLLDPGIGGLFLSVNSTAAITSGPFKINVSSIAPVLTPTGATVSLQVMLN
jgi:hypothetical protein